MTWRPTATVSTRSSCCVPRTASVMDKYGKLADDLHTDLHECLGHGSGQLAPGVKGGELKSYGSTLEETRADLFGLYYLGDPKMVELGLMPSFDVAKAGYAKYILNGMMTQLARIEPGKNVEESHMRNRKLICEWCYERGKADNVIEMVRKERQNLCRGQRFRKAAPTVRRHAPRGAAHQVRRRLRGRQGACRAVCRPGRSELHREVRDRYYALGIEPYGGFVNPEFELVEKDGKVVDVKISYPANYVRADARLLEELFFPAEYQLTRGRSQERKQPPNCSGGSFYRESSAGMLPCFRRGLALRKGAATSLSGWSSACIRIRRPSFRPLVIQSRACYAIPFTGLRHLRAGSPLVSRRVRLCCTRMPRGHSPVLRCAGRPADATRSARSCSVAFPCRPCRASTIPRRPAIPIRGGSLHPRKR